MIETILSRLEYRLWQHQRCGYECERAQGIGRRRFFDPVDAFALARFGFGYPRRRALRFAWVTWTDRWSILLRRWRRGR